MDSLLQEKYIITYSNHFKIGNKTFAFRKKNLFDISFIPNFKPLQANGGSYGYWIDRHFYTLSKLEKITVKESIEVDVSNLNWNVQIELDDCFNLEK